MTVMATSPGFAGIAADRPFTVRDLEAITDATHRYELVDGVLVVSPAPGWPHQEGQAALFVQLRLACPPGLRVLTAPFAVQLDEANEVQPDVLVTRYQDLTEANLPVAPLLVVEFLSRSSRLYDLGTKKAVYERMGVRGYWVVDPAEPGRLQVFELDADGRYAEVAQVRGDGEFRAEWPFPVTVVPARLLDGLRPDPQ